MSSQNNGYAIKMRPSQNVPAPRQMEANQPALYDQRQAYTREQLKEDMKTRGSRSKPYSARPGETAWAFEKEQMSNQGYTGAQKKRGLRGLLATDHAAGAEKEARKELWHAEKAERFATRARDPALTDRQRRSFLRKAAKQQASADFHESLKKKHIIGATPGHKYQAVPAIATHHPIIHDNATNTVRTTVNDQVFQPSRIQVGPSAFDGISEVGSRQSVEPHPAVMNVPTNIKPQKKWKGQVPQQERKISESQPAYIPTGDRTHLPTPIIGADPFLAREQQLKNQKLYQQSQFQQPQYYNQQQSQWLYSYPPDEEHDDDYDSEDEIHQSRQRGISLNAAELQQGQNWRSQRAPVSSYQLREGAERLQHARSETRNPRFFNANQLQTQSQQLRKAPTLEKGGLSVYADEWSRRKQWRQLNQQNLQNQQSGQQKPFVVYAQQPALQRQASNLKKAQTKQSQQRIQGKDLKLKSQQLRKAQTVEKGGMKIYASEYAKKRQQNQQRSAQYQQQNPQAYYFQHPQQQMQQQMVQQQQMQQPLQQQMVQQPIQMSKLEQQNAYTAAQAQDNNRVLVTVAQTNAQ